MRVRRHRPWRRRFLWLIVGALALIVAWGGFAAASLNSQMTRLPAGEMPSLDPVIGGPVNYLFVGSDSRENLDESLGDNFSSTGGERADVIMIVHTVPSSRTVQMLSLPRDLKVDVPGHGVNKINAALAFGGPDLLVATVKQATGLSIHHYVEVGFSQFAEVVDAVGGVSLTFPNAARDDQSGLDVQAGTTELDGAQAVAYARSRQYEELTGNGWTKIEANDIGRTARQQRLLAELLRKARWPGNVFRAPGLASSLGAALIADDRLTMMDMARLGLGVAAAGEFDGMTLPVRISNEGGVSFVVMTTDADAVLGAFAVGDPFPAVE